MFETRKATGGLLPQTSQRALRQLSLYRFDQFLITGPRDTVHLVMQAGGV